MDTKLLINQKSVWRITVFRVIFTSWSLWTFLGFILFCAVRFLLLFFVSYHLSTSMMLYDLILPNWYAVKTNGAYWTMTLCVYCYIHVPLFSLIILFRVTVGEIIPNTNYLNMINESHSSYIFPWNATFYRAFFQKIYQL